VCVGKCINTGYRTSITKDSTVAAKADVAAYKLRKGQNGEREEKGQQNVELHYHIMCM